MRSARKRKLIIVSLSVLVTTLATGLILFALKKNINLYYTPAELLASDPLPKGEIKLGGMVKSYTAKPVGNQLQVQFIITDFKQQIPVFYQGIVPDLFREGKGVVVSGKYINGRFAATQVLAKHDENYMPPNLPGMKSDGT